jgi:hypothetical protein
MDRANVLEIILVEMQIVPTYLAGDSGTLLVGHPAGLFPWVSLRYMAVFNVPKWGSFVLESENIRPATDSARTHP